MKSPLSVLALVTSTVLLLFACGGGGADPESSAQRLDRLNGWIAEGRFTDVVAELEPRFAAGQCDAGESLCLAVARQGQNEVPKAERVLRTALEADPAAHALSNRLADIYVALEVPEKALKVLEAARAQGGSDRDLALPLGVVRGLLGQYEEAEQEFLRARQAGSEEDGVDFNMALLLANKGERDRAEEQLMGILERSPGRQSARRELARIRLEGAPTDRERALEVRDLVNLVLEADQEDWRAWEVLGDAEMVLEDATAAKVYYTYALKHGKNPSRVEDKYRIAARIVLDQEKALGIAPEEQPRRGGPPIPASIQERARQAREDAEAGKKEQDGAPEDPR